MWKIEYLIETFNKSFDYILYAGAGEHCDLGLIQQIGFNYLTLLEADKQQASRLDDKVIDLLNVKVVNKALGIDSQRSTYNLASNPTMSSSLHPEKITTFYPSLEFKEQVDTQSISLVDIISELDIQAGKNNLLILDVNGLESAIFEAFSEHLFNYFSALLVRTSQEELYSSGVAGFNAITSKLREEFVDYLVFPEPNPPFVNVIVNHANAREFKSNAYRLEDKNKYLSTKISDMDQAFSSDVKNLKKRIKKITRQYTQTQEEYNKLSEASDNLKRQVESYARLVQENQAEKSRLSRDLEEFEVINAELTRLNSDLVNEKAKLAQDLSDQQADFERENQQLKSRISEIESLLSQTTKQHDEELSSLKAEKSQVACNLEEFEVINAELTRLNSDLADEKLKLAQELSDQQTGFAKENQQLKSRISEIESVLSQTIKQHDEKLSSLKAEKSQFSRDLEEFEAINADLTRLNSDLADEKAKMAQDLSDQQAGFERENQQLKSRISEIESVLSQTIKQHDEKLLSLKADSEKSYEQIKLQSSHFEDEKQSWLSQVKKLREEREQERGVLNTTCKLNLKLQADLDNMRVQYSEKVHAEKELTDLISELYVKLKQASEFYYKLEENYPEIARKFDE